MCKRIVEELSCDIVLIGSPRESDICAQIAAGLPGKILDLCGKLDLGLSCALIGWCDLLVSSDGGPLHIGQALGKKIVAFFGPVDENVYGAYPDQRLVKVFTAPVPCGRAMRFVLTVVLK